MSGTYRGEGVAEVQLRQMSRRRPPVEGAARSYSIPMVCVRFDQSGLLYDLYRRPGQSIHPSLDTLRAYHNVYNFEDQKVNSVGALHVPHDLYMSLGFSAVMAVDVLERLRLGQPHLAVVEKIAEAAALLF